MGRKFKIQVTTMDSKKKKSLKWVGLVFNAHPAQLSLELGEEGRKRVGRDSGEASIKLFKGGSAELQNSICHERNEPTTKSDLYHSLARSYVVRKS